MRFAAATIALLLAVATATPVPDVDEANLAKETKSRPIVDLGLLEAHETRAVNIADVVVARAVDEVENSLERRVWPHSHQSDIFKAGRGYNNRIVTALIINGVNVAVTAWFNDIHTLFLSFDPAFPSAPNFITAGVEDLSTGMERAPWKINWDSSYTLSTKGSERLQFDNSFVMWWK